MLKVYACADFSNKLEVLMENKKWKIVVAAQGNLFYINSKGKFVPVFTEKQTETLRINYPTFSPDGKQIAYCQYDGQDNYIFIYNVLDRTKKFFYKNKLGIKNLSFSPDGKNILFLSYYNYKFETLDLCVLDIETNKVRIIANDIVNAINVCTPSWSADSKKIIFSGINGKIIQVDLENNALNELFDGICPSYSPNGKYIVFREGKHEYKRKDGSTDYIMSGFKYYLYNIAGQQKEFLFNGKHLFGIGANVWEAVIWSPDSEFIMFFETYDVPYVEKIHLMDIKSKEKKFFTKGVPFSAGAISWISFN